MDGSTRVRAPRWALRIRVRVGVRHASRGGELNRSRIGVRAGAGHAREREPTSAQDRLELRCWCGARGRPRIPFSWLLEARENVLVDLRLVSEGLDNRRVTREYGSYALAAGQPIMIQVPLSDLPLQTVSHSATGSVEVSITRANGTNLTMHSPTFQHHFNSNYDTIITYPYDLMVDQFQGGQLGQIPGDVEGRVYIDGSWRSIQAQRLLEYQVTIPFAPPIDTVAPELVELPPWQPISGQRLCLDWRTQYLDAAHGEDVAGTYGVQTVDASHAVVTIERVVDFYACSGSSPGACGAIVWEGPLDAAGCILVPDSEVGDQYYVWLHGQFVKEVDGVATTATIHWHKDGQFSLPPPLPPVIRLSAVHRPEGLGSPYHPFEPPYPELDIGQADHVFVVWRAWQNAAAVMSLLFKSPFLSPGRSITVQANAGCQSSNPEIPRNDACTLGSTFYTGPWAVEFSGGPFLHWRWPGVLQYKYVIAHEAGHIAMGHGGGWPRNDYEYIGGSTAACRCDHVTGANQLHCMQSVEYASAAQVEGFAHFIAASLFNEGSGSDCHFNYYKEFREDDGTVVPPPYSVDCRNPVKWRDSHPGCFFWNAGTEYDWMQFYWNVHNVGINTSTIDDLFAIYRYACGGALCSSAHDVSWSVLDHAAQGHFGMFDPRYVKFADTGDAFGVDEDL